MRIHTICTNPSQISAIAFASGVLSPSAENVIKIIIGIMHSELHKPKTVLTTLHIPCTTEYQNN